MPTTASRFLDITLDLSCLSALYLNNLLERDECSKDELEVCSNPAIPSIFTEACTNGVYIEVGRPIRELLSGPERCNGSIPLAGHLSPRYSEYWHYFYLWSLQPWNDFMNCSGEEQERLLSLLEEEGAKKKSASRLPKDGRNGDRPSVLVDVGLFAL